MDSRKVSSMSNMSNMSTMSLASEGSDPSDNRLVSNLIIEEIGQISIGEASQAKSISSSENYVCALSGESQIFVIEAKLKSDTDCAASRKALLDLPGVQEEKRYLDVTMFSTGSGDVRLALLGERKNKERFVSIVELLTGGRSFGLGKELAVYDKASMLGKGLSHIVSCWSGRVGEADVFVCGSILRKLKVEENGSVLKPTTGRVPVPPECLDGTISVCVSSSTNKKGFSVISSFRTKSAGKNKYQINWFQGKNDEISVPGGKCFLKLPEEQEPIVILANPRDSRAIFLICNNSSDQTSSLHKLVRGRKLADPIFTFPFPVSDAIFISGVDKNLFLLALDCSSQSLKVFHLSKTEGFRGQESTWSACHELAAISPSFHAVSCSQHRWQLMPALADIILSDRCPYQVGLATLLTAGGDIAKEPETGLPYRLRVMGGDQQNDVIIILLDDLERTFDSEEDALSTMTLKMCMNSSPGREGLSQISAWLMAGRLASVEIQSSRLETVSGSERMVLQALHSDTLRSFLVDTDWTQSTKREATFLLDSTERPSSTPAHIRSSTPISRRTPVEPQPSRSRIPAANFKSSLQPDTGHDDLATADLMAAIGKVEDTISPLARANCEIRDSLASLEKNLVILKNISASGGTGRS